MHTPMSDTDLSDGDAPAYEQSADEQLYPTVGPSAGESTYTGGGSPALVDAITSEIRAPPKLGVPDDDSGVPVGHDRERKDLPPMALPGFGERTETCGDDIPRFCEDCGDVAIVGRTCKRSVCPRCGAAWVRDRAENVGGRLAAGRAMRDATEPEQQRFHHLAFMPPSDWFLDVDDPLGASFQVIRGMLEAMDLEGYVFYHPWAGEGSLEEKSREGDEDGEHEWFSGDGEPERDATEDDRGAWKHRLFNEREWSDVREELELRPHFHVVAIGHEVPGGQTTADVFDRTGWVLKRITKSPESNVSLYDEMDMVRAVTYCISHTAIDTSGPANQVQYRKYGSALNTAEVYDDTEREISKKVRAVAPKTLGISLSSQLCTTERIKPPSEQSDGSARGFLAGSSSSAASSDELGPAASSAPGTGAGSGDVELPEGGNLPDAPGGVEGETVGDVDEIEPEPCEGRMIHIRNAEDYLGNEEWVDEAEHADVLQTTWDEWADRLDEEILGG